LTAVAAGIIGGRLDSSGNESGGPRSSDGSSTGDRFDGLGAGVDRRTASGGRGVAAGATSGGVLSDGRRSLNNGKSKELVIGFEGWDLIASATGAA
jgi:hypothetical protein